MIKTNRFPGSRPFTKEFKDIFFGRKQDIIDLQKYVMVEKLTVMYGKSGLGKSSLINAGLVPEIENKYIILFVRFGNYSENSKNLPLEILNLKLSEFSSKPSFLNNVENEDISLWQSLKNIQVNSPEKEGILLIFDQFEELFTFPQGVTEFVKEFADVLNNKVPKTFRRMLNLKLQKNPDILTDEEIAMIDTNINLKVLMSIRSDRMSNLNKMSESIPNILRNCYELKPLNRVHP